MFKHRLADYCVERVISKRKSRVGADDICPPILDRVHTEDVGPQEIFPRMSRSEIQDQAVAILFENLHHLRRVGIRRGPLRETEAGRPTVMREMRNTASKRRRRPAL